MFSEAFRAHRPCSCSMTTKTVPLPMSKARSFSGPNGRVSYSCGVLADRAARRAHSLGIVGTGFIAGYVYDFLLDTGWEIEGSSLYDKSLPRARNSKTRRAAQSTKTPSQSSPS